MVRCVGFDRFEVRDACVFRALGGTGEHRTRNVDADNAASRLGEAQRGFTAAAPDVEYRLTRRGARGLDDFIADAGQHLVEAVLRLHPFLACLSIPEGDLIGIRWVRHGVFRCKSEAAA